MRPRRGPTRIAARTYVPVMIDGRTAMAKHTKAMVLIIVALTFVTIVIEALS
jgi:hypothetical protein